MNPHCPACPFRLPMGMVIKDNIYRHRCVWCTPRSLFEAYSVRNLIQYLTFLRSPFNE